MSGLVKGIKKVFQKVARFVKKYWKVIVIAVAVYFTAGVAMSYFGSTATFASSMPGFGAGGMFSKAAVAMGFQGSAAVSSGLSQTAGLVASGTAFGPVGGGAVGDVAAGGVSGTISGGAAAPAAGLEEVAVTGTKIAGAATPTAEGMAAMGSEALVAGAATPAAATDLSAALIKSLEWQNKLGIAKMAFDVAGGALAPDPDELDESAHARRYGSAFGIGRDGEGPGFAGTGSAFANMNKRMPSAGQGSSFAAQAPTSQGATAQGPSQFLARPFDPAEVAAETESTQQDFIPNWNQKANYLPT